MTQADEAYFDWLVAQTGCPDGNPSFRYLFQILHQCEFVWTVTGDDNRAQDGKDLRYEFFHDAPDHGTLNPETASFLEVLIGLSRKLAFHGDKTPEAWVVILLRNLGLNPVLRPEQIGEIVYRCIWRQYYRDGLGGFFPLGNPREDQTKVEIWHQMHAYINENVPT